MPDDPFSYVIAGAIQLRNDALVREFERDITWAEHIADVMALTEKVAGS